MCLGICICNCTLLNYKSKVTQCFKSSSFVAMSYAVINNNVTIILTSRLVFTARLRPSSECPQLGLPLSFDRCTLPHRRFNQNIPSSVVLPQQCHCRNRHRGKLQNLSPPSVLFESSPNFFTIHRRHRRKKMMEENFEI